MKKLLIALITIMMVTVMSLGFTACSGESITIGTKDFGENILLGEIYAQLIENNSDIKVNRKLNLGGTFVCFEAIKNGGIDIYPEYTGTGMTAHLNLGVNNDPDETYDIVKSEFNTQFNIAWLEPHGFNNTYAIAVTSAAAETYSLTKCSDLVGVSQNLIFGAEHEFFNREDGFEGFIAAYGIAFKDDPAKMNVSLKYQAIGQGTMDVTDAFATDAEIIKYNLVLLEDDLGFFPPYYAAPIIRNETLEKYPQLEQILNRLSGIITDEVMTQLNYKTSIDQKSMAVVAKEFLEDYDLI